MSQLRFAFAAATDLSPLAYLVAKELDRTPRRYDTCLESTRSIAAAVGRSARSVQLALRELAAKGLVEVRRCRRWLGRLVNSGHRITLLWRTAKAPADAPPPLADAPVTPIFLGAIDCATAAQEIAPHPGPPLDSPLEEPEGEGEVIGDGEPGPVPPPPPVVVAPDREEATAEPDPALVARAAKVHPAHPSPARWIASLLARFAPAWVEAALSRAEAKARKEPLTNPPGYVANTLRGFEAEGGPPAAPPTREELDARRREEKRAARERFERRMAEAEGRR